MLRMSSIGMRWTSLIEWPAWLKGQCHGGKTWKKIRLTFSSSDLELASGIAIIEPFLASLHRHCNFYQNGTTISFKSAKTHFTATETYK